MALVDKLKAAYQEAANTSDPRAIRLESILSTLVALCYDEQHAAVLAALDRIMDVSQSVALERLAAHRPSASDTVIGQ